MKTRVTVEQFERTYGTKGDEGEDWQEEAQIVATSQKAIGAFLRALADEIDPPKTSGNY